MGNIKSKSPKTNADITKLLLADAKPSADAAAFLKAIMDEVGGERALARIFASQLRDPDTGAQTKQRLLDTIQRLIIMCTQHDLAKQVEPSEMTDEDLERVSMRLLTKVQHGQSTGAGAEG